MQFNVQMTCDNDAFAEDPNPEVARILRELADRVERGEVDNHIGRTQYRSLFDINGNNVGAASYVRTGPGYEVK